MHELGLQQTNIRMSLLILIQNAIRFRYASEFPTSRSTKPEGRFDSGLQTIDCIDVITSFLAA